MAAVMEGVAAHPPNDISLGSRSEEGGTVTVKSVVCKNTKVSKAVILPKDLRTDSKINNNKSDGGLDQSSHKRSLRYDSADSSDSGVGGESLVWSPCSSLLSYSPPPLLSDLEDDISSEGTHLACHPPSPPQSSPSSPTDASTIPCHVILMAPNDVSGGVRVCRKGSNADSLVDRCNGGMPLDPLDATNTHHLHDDVNTPHKDRPPDPLATSPRVRRLSSKTTSSLVRSPRKRGVDGYADLERRLKACRAYANGGSETLPFEGGQVTTEPGLLARLSGLHEEERRTVSRSSPRGKGYSRKGDREDKSFRHSLKGRNNGALWRSQEEVSKLKEAKQMLSNINNNLASRNNNNLSQSIECERRVCSSLFEVTSLPPSLANSEPPSSLKQSFSNSFSSSSSSTSGVGSSLHDESSSPNSGTSTPTLPPLIASSVPILKSAPKVRFPAPEKKEVGEKDVCRWHDCGANMDQSSSLLEHIQAVHVEGQLEAESFRCLWVGCKVFDRASCSVSWLERHVLTHGGHKPFKCIVEGCGLRFRSQTALGRHVNHHFNSPTAAPAPRVQNHSSPTKLIRKNGRKLRYRKRPWSARVFDFFDLSTMEKVRWGLYCASEAQSKEVFKAPIDHVIFKPEVLCRRQSIAGERELLIQWSPNDILPNEWIKPEDFVEARSVPFHKLSHEGQMNASKILYPSFKPPSLTNRRKRPPLKKTNSIFGDEIVSMPNTHQILAASGESIKDTSKMALLAKELCKKNGKIKLSKI